MKESKTIGENISKVKTYASDKELLAWFIFSELQEVPPAQETPDTIASIISDFKATRPTVVYLSLQENYQEFREKFYEIAQA